MMTQKFIAYIFKRLLPNAGKEMERWLPELRTGRSGNFSIPTLRTAIILIAFCLCACGGNTRDESGIANHSVDPSDSTNRKANPGSSPDPVKPQLYSNARVREATVEKSGDNRYTIKGKGQIFEANFGWVVEDGHRELKQGFEMTDAGAPAWGNFSFTIEVQRERPNSTLTLVLFETSAKDGSRQHELAIPLNGPDVTTP